MYKSGENECVCRVSSVTSGWLQWLTRCVISTSLQHGFTLISMVTMRTSTDAELNLNQWRFLRLAVLSLQTWLSEITHNAQNSTGSYGMKLKCISPSLTSARLSVWCHRGKKYPFCGFAVRSHHIWQVEEEFTWVYPAVDSLFYWSETISTTIDL